jgi:predicted DNA-binding ribbon-helix-helix protein
LPLKPAELFASGLKISDSFKEADRIIIIMVIRYSVATLRDRPLEEERGHEIVVKRSIVVAGHKTSVSLEDAFWEGLKDIAKARRVTLSDLVGSIDTEREHGNLSSALRLFVLGHYQKRAASGLVVDSIARAAEYTNVQ